MAKIYYKNCADKKITSVIGRSGKGGAGLCVYFNRWDCMNIEHTGDTMQSIWKWIFQNSSEKEREHST